MAIVTDNFNRPNSTTLGGVWNESEFCGGACGLAPAFIARTFEIDVNQCRMDNAFNDGVIIRPTFGRAIWNQPFLPNQWSEYLLDTQGGHIRAAVGVRMSGIATAFTGYTFHVGAPSDGINRVLMKWVGASLEAFANGILLASAAGGALGGTWRLEIIGTTLRVYRNGVFEGAPFEVIDADIATGQAGLAIIGITQAQADGSSPAIHIIDDWAADGVILPSGKSKKMGGSGSGIGLPFVRPGTPPPS